jgi:8'-apo-carotenoid 13,14-cleaving dioxygenase
VIFDACVHDSMFATSTQGPDSSKVPFERWSINPQSKCVARRVIDPQAQEFPRPDERFTSKPYRYAFTVALPESGTTGGTAILKHDLTTGTREVHDFGGGRIPGEFMFIPRSEDAAEGDGWLMGYVVDLNTETTDLVILDAANFTGEPVATVHIPHRIPPGFHGNWIDS